VGGRELEIVTIPARRSGAPTLVFLHEGLGSTGLWRDVPSVLAERTGCAALVYSRYGNGFSAPLQEARTPRYMHDEALAALPSLLAEQDVRDAILIGHSDGASIAIIFASEHPSIVRGVVLEAPHVFVEELSVRSIAAIRDVYETGGLRERMGRYHADVDRTFYGWNDVWLSPQFRDWNIEAYAARVRAPLLAIQGLEDEYGTVAQIDALARHARGPVDRLLLARCGHTPHRDRDALVVDTAASWIASLL
jgi:pimeloyl-ACP methyl ester carboxylesterase